MVTPDKAVRCVVRGPELVTLVHARIERFAENYRALYPAAVKPLLPDREQATSYLNFPVEHHKRIRHSNLIERTFDESRRRVKVIRQFPGEHSCITRVWATLHRATSRRCVAVSPQVTLELGRLSRRMFEAPIQLHRQNHAEDMANITDVGAVA